MKPANSLIPDEFELTIDALSYHGGRGVGRVEGMVVFVPGAAPGDRLRAKVTARRSRFAEAEIVELLEPSPARRRPPCPVAERCGGCSWQHVEYPVQVAQKEKILRDSLRGFDGITWLPFLAAPDEFHYRNRIQVQTIGGRRGFFAKRSRELVEISECWIAEQAVNERLRELSPADIGEAQRVEIALSEDGGVHVRAGSHAPETALFSQVNRAQNEALISRVLAFAADGPEWIFDLYAGAGNLTFPLAERHPEASITGIELSRASVDRAKARGGRVKWVAGDVGAELKRLTPRRGRGLIVLDPPRPGCDRAVIGQLLRHRPSQVIYVSCNPSTFARDVQRLQPAYQLHEVQGLDMFPQTEHVELVANLRAAH